MTPTEILIGLLIAGAAILAAIMWAWRVEKDRRSAEYRADFARPCGAGYLTHRDDYPESARIHRVTKKDGQIVGVESLDYGDRFPGGVTGVPVAETPIVLSDREEQRRSFAYGNLAIDRPEVTRADIDRAAETMDREVTR